MRNLKKVLSLTLAFVMLLGMMVVGAGAVDTGFPDDDKIAEDNKEAVAVMNAISIFVGNDKGDFNPDGKLTRAAAAKIVLSMVQGTSTVDALLKNTTSTMFDDMSAANVSWAAGIVDVCANLDIIKGTAERTFNPNGEVTGIQFAAMVARAADPEGDYNDPATWQTNVRLFAIKNGLTDNITISDWNAPLTRGQAAQMSFNGLNYTESGVETGKFIITVEASADAAVKALAGEVVDSRSEALLLVNTSGAASNNVYGTDWNLVPQTDNSGSLAADVFGLSSANTVDAFGNLTKTWSSTKDADLEVVVAKDAAASFDTKVSPSEIYNALGLKTSTSATYTVDGVAQANETLARNDTTKDIGAVGAVTNVYKSGNTVSIVTVNNYLAQVTAVTEAKEATDTKEAVDASVTLRVFGAGASEATVTGKTFKTEGYAKDDYVVVTVDKSDSNAVKSIAPVDVVEGVITAHTTSSITIDGEKYAIAGTNTGNNTMKTDGGTIGFTATWTYYVVDGVILGGEVKSASVSTDYVYVTKIEATEGDSLIGGSTNRVVADATFTDGTHAVIDLAIGSDSKYGKPAADGTVTSTLLDAVNGDDDDTGDADGSVIGNWFAYTVDEDVYTLSEVHADYAGVKDSGLTLTKGVPTTVNSTKYTNNATSIVGIDTAANKYAVTTATGLVGATLTGKVLYTYAKGSNIISAIYVVDQALSVQAQTYAYALSKGATVKNGTEWTFAIDGEEQTKIVKNSPTNEPVVGKVYTLSESANDTVDTTDATNTVYATVNSKVTTAQDEFFINADSMYLIGDSTKVYDVTSEADPAGAESDVSVDSFVVVVHDNQSPKTALLVYIVDDPAADCEHTFGAWNAATGTRTCSKCGTVETCSHTYGEWGTPGTADDGKRTCETCGHEDTCAHAAYGSWNATTGKRDCTTCGHQETCAHTAGTWTPGHAAGGDPSTDPAVECEKTCDVCGYQMSHHAFTDDDADGTCDTAHS